MKLSFEIVELQTKHAFNIARQVGPPSRRLVWVRVRDSDGVEGWGEASPQPFYGETADTVTAILPRLAEALEEAAGGDPFALERIDDAVHHALAHNGSARVAISAAMHDLVGKRLGVPVWKLWGLDPAAAPRSSFTIGIDELEVMRAKVREAAAYPILKIKVGTPRDREILSMIREEAPGKTIRVDANTGWSAKQTIAVMPMFQEFGVEFVEQPLPAHDLAGLRLVRENSPLPIIADESVENATDVAKLAGVVDGVNIKLSKCGSLREAIRIIHAARAHNMKVMLGCMIESTLGIAAAVQITPLVDYVDLDGAALLAHDPFAGPGIEADGTVRFNSEPGLGVRRRE
ncbi:dipeptide epimerase [Longimicrobium terrae]|uniref:Dipeptide epimerase n=1 Tax=Longimicrobium terrae TaxID=1639882 RepID=A0A841H425_9BACT|nr:dipeptide epimerase [Longimicrobium terrae]MBB4638429.1 L-alanine-DL-glutamate epimerase-like enolase superfamily enzyme [Longimicrobium terrae]MBB6072728.1 L-alanine-DL-glutamate epimerase-like enolase superfamily enzyme [Longimicrobium terrae]NNC32398.1 dipeptide epimerase [Longimicrobium terrae]